MAAQDERLVAITPAMREGSGLVDFSERYPDRYFDVAIAEQHSVTLAAGLASAGLKPVVAIYSSFLQRAYDQVIHDVAVQNLPVLFALDRAGAVGPDGPTHNGSYDLTFLRCLPNFVVMAPANENECRQMLYTGVTLDQPVAVRYPRGVGPGVPVTAQMSALSIGRAEIRRRGSAIALLAFGSMVAPALEAADTLNATVVNMRFVKPLDERMILELASAHALLVTLEDNVVAGGAGSAVNECLAAHGVQAAILNLGMPDCFLEQGSREDMLAECGLDARSILRRLAPYRRAVRGKTAAEIARSA
jgi:1-deoxy-D-xylulose-5-phosphate synthase